MTLTRPIAGDPLSSSNGKPSTQILDEAFDLVDDHQRALAGQAFVSASEFPEVGESVINGAESLTGWFATNTAATASFDTSSNSGGGPSLDTTPTTAGASGFSTGTASVTARLLSLNAAKFYYNLPSPVAVTANKLVVADLQYLTTSIDLEIFELPSGAFSLIAADGAGLTGNRAATVVTSENILDTMRVYANLDIDDLGQPRVKKLWYSIPVDVSSLSQVASIGIARTDGGTGSGSQRWWFDNIRWGASTGIDQAGRNASSNAVVIPASYTATAPQRSFSPTLYDKTFLDLRPHQMRGGTYHTRDWLIDDTGATDVTSDLATVMNSMPQGSTLQFTPGGSYLVDNEIDVDGLKDVIFDAQGARFFVSKPKPTPFFTSTDCYRVTFRGFRIFGNVNGTVRGPNMVVQAGTPAVSGNSRLLTVQNDQVRYPNQVTVVNEVMRPGRDKDGNYVYTFTLSDTNHIANDCEIMMISAEDGSAPGVPDGTKLASQLLTLTGTPTEYVLTYAPRDLSERVAVAAKKVTATANTISFDKLNTKHNVQSYDADWEENAGFKVMANNVECLWEDIHVEGILGDSIQCSAPGNRQNTIRRLFARNTGRQGLSINYGDEWLLEDFVIREGRRHGIDIEPYTANWSVNDLTIRHGVIMNNWLGSLLIQHAVRTKNITIQDVRCVSTSVPPEADIAISADGGSISNLIQDHAIREPYPAMSGSDTYATFGIGGRNLTVRDIVVTTNLYVEGGDPLTEDGVTIITGGHDISGVRVAQPLPYGSIVNKHSSNVIRDVSTTNSEQQFYPGPGGGIWPGIGPVRMPSGSVFSALDLGPVRTQYPNTYKGIAHSSIWEPGGRNALDEPTYNMRGISGGATKSNNLRGLAVAVSAGATTATVAFATRAYPNPTSIVCTSGNTTGGTLTPSTTYYFRVAGRQRYGGPPVPLAQVTKATASNGNYMQIRVNGLGNAAAGIHIAGITVYRGTVSGGPYTQRFDVVPTESFFGTGAVQYFNDLGTTGTFAPNTTVVQTDFTEGWGYPASIPVQNGSFVPVDETGYEPDTSYAIFLEASWQTTWRISAKRTNGFDIEFGVPCPTGGGTVSWFLVR